jgi:hypothetical protein
VTISHLGRSGPIAVTATKNWGKIEGIPVTDDFSKWKGIRFESIPSEVERGGGDEGVGCIEIKFFRAGKVFKEANKDEKKHVQNATGFHRSDAVRVLSLSFPISSQLTSPWFYRPSIRFPLYSLSPLSRMASRIGQD